MKSSSLGEGVSAQADGVVVNMSPQGNGDPPARG